MKPTTLSDWSDIGAATLELSTGEKLTYRCEPELHRIIVHDSDGQMRFGFGGQGSGPGQFDTPMDVVLVAPEFQGEELAGDAAEAAWLAVADYGNRRVQIFDLDGCFIGAVADSEDADAGPPCRLTWRAPSLVVDSLDGARTAKHLTAALLFDSTRFGGERAEFRTMMTSGETH
jgi:hypothetical protein